MNRTIAADPDTAVEATREDTPAAAPAAPPIFVFGTLRDPDVLAVALGPEHAGIAATPARLPGYRALTAAAGPFPALRPAPGDAGAPGLLLSPATAEVRRRLDAFEGPFAFALAPVTVEGPQGPVRALAYLADEVAVTGRPWVLEEWAATDKPLFLEMAREAAAFGPVPLHARGGLIRRALARLSARRRTIAPVLRTGFGRGDIAEHAVTRRHSGFFVTEEHVFRHRRFDGSMSPPISRETFVTGDTVAVLPWDPRSDRVLLIEQVRAGLLARGEPDPWHLEVVAGFIDRGERPEDAARREAAEEAGLTLGRLHRIGSFYLSPGALTEMMTSFIGEADLSGVAEGVHGVATEHEDIRAFVVPRADAVAALDTGEAGNAPLAFSLMALELHRARLTEAWGG
ncbi:NUDIX domain-containing protein [Rhodobacteraceae bacterium 2CG4]|uniref:ADP-ribose pyrophosphatase n=1 Tax=Halovulum marinum TaxID=2662447 RepID=A0A6L5Z3D6_9RHOB|nr:NUDIX domain-containing protein [Halovulum marinum]MSU90522.1 NUDIX domain-containing protein [Halovulum marinum]